jgi:hypothetical protein
MTEMMMKPDEGLADRLADVRYSVAVGHVKTLAGYDATERSPLQCAAAGELAMSTPEACRLRIAWRDTIVSYTAGISDDTLLDDLAAWIERCAKPPFDPAPVAEALIADIASVTRGRLDGLSRDERIAVQDYVGQEYAWRAHAPYGYVANVAVGAALRDLG